MGLNLTMTNQNGFADVLIGLQYGDEGKARVIDFLADQYDVIARFNGGANAGHTIETKDGGKVALNQIPSAIFHAEKILYIGSGCVVNVEKLANEIEKVEGLGIPLKTRLKISCQASIVQPHHLFLDVVMGKGIGSTKNGIGPCYADKAFRMDGERLLNIRLGDLLEDSDGYFAKIQENLNQAIKHYDLKVEDPNHEIEKLKHFFNLIKDLIEPDTLYLQKKVENGGKVLFEGAQAVMLDVTKGSVPYVTSSLTIAAAAFSGGDLSPQYHRKTIGVAKAVMSRVGHGPFASEFGGAESEKYCMTDDGMKYTRDIEAQNDIGKLIHSENAFEVGIAMRILSGEYGTVTKRPRRVGNFDLVQLNYAIRMNGVTELVINKCDILKEYSRTYLNKIPLVVAYNLRGQKIDYVPGSVASYYKVEPILENSETFDEDISMLKSFDAIPQELKSFISKVENFCNCKVTGIGVGPEREQFITIN